MFKYINLTESGKKYGYPETPEPEMNDIGIFKGTIIRYLKSIFTRIKR